MVDTLVTDSNPGDLNERTGLWGPYWLDDQIAIIVFVNVSARISFARTINGGVDWSETFIVLGNARHIAAWYDKETPGDISTGTLVHIAWLNATDDECSYVTVDVSDASVSTIRTIASGLNVPSTSSLSRVAISRAVNGDVMIAFSTNSDVTETHTSTDLFDTNDVTRADVFDAANTDWVLLYPADVDPGDFAAIYWDRSVNQISVKIFDSSADTWDETLISGSMVDGAAFMLMDAAVRHSDSRILLGAHSRADHSSDDLRTWEITVDTIPVGGADIVEKANVFTNQVESAQVSVHINQQPSPAHVRIAYLKGGTFTFEVDVVFHLSTDGMASWAAESAYSEDGPEDYRLVHAGRTVGDDGGRYQPAFYDDDDLELFVNLVNDIEIAAVGGPPESISIISVTSGLNVIRMPDSVVAY